MGGTFRPPTNIVFSLSLYIFYTHAIFLRARIPGYVPHVPTVPTVSVAD